MCSQSRILAGECISENQAAFGYSPFGKREAGVSNTAWPNNILVSGGESFSITGRLTHDFGWATLTSVTTYSENDFKEGLEGGRGPPSVTLATAKDRKSVVQGKSVSVRIALGGRRVYKK